MAATPLLGIIQVATNQNSKEATINDGTLVLERATQATLPVSMAAGNVTLTALQFASAVCFICSSGLVATTLTVPLTSRFFVVVNNCAYILTVGGATGAYVAIPIGGTAIIQCTGIDCLALGGGGVANALSFQGAWNAATNVPALASGVGTKGYVYTVSVAGTTALDGITVWAAGDQVAYNGTAWEKFSGGSAGAMTYQGSWNAATNVPALVSGVGVKGAYYTASTAGATLLDGTSAWAIGDKVAFNGTTWEKFSGGAGATPLGVNQSAVTVETGVSSLTFIGAGVTATKTATGAVTINVPSVPVSLSTPVGFIFPNKPQAGQVINIPVSFAQAVPANFVGTVGFSGTLPTADMVFTLSLIPISTGVAGVIGTVTLRSAGAALIALSTQAAVQVVPGDVLQMKAPAIQDTTGADLGIALLTQKQVPISSTAATIPFIFPGKPAAGQTLNIPLALVQTIPANLVGTVGYSGTLPTADMVFTLRLIPISTGVAVPVGTVTLRTTGKFVVILSTQAATSSTPGDVLQIAAPAVQDATGSDIGIALSVLKN